MPGVSQASDISDRPRVHFGFWVFVRILFSHALELNFSGIGEGIFQVEGTGQFGNWNPQTVGGVSEDGRSSSADATVLEEAFVVKHRIFEEIAGNL